MPADFVSVSGDTNDMAITVKLPPDAGIEGTLRTSVSNIGRTACSHIAQHVVQHGVI